MSIKVDPFIRQIPKAFVNDPEVREFFYYLIRWNHDMWMRTGGGDDKIDELFNINGYETSALLGKYVSVLTEFENLKNSINSLNYLKGKVAALETSDDTIFISTLGYKAVQESSPSTQGNKFPQQQTFSISTKGS